MKMIIFKPEILKKCSQVFVQVRSKDKSKKEFILQHNDRRDNCPPKVRTLISLKV